MKRTKLIEFLQKCKDENVYIAIPFSEGHVESCNEFIIESTADDEICITTSEITSKLAQ